MNNIILDVSSPAEVPSLTIWGYIAIVFAIIAVIAGIVLIIAHVCNKKKKNNLQNEVEKKEEA